MSRQTGSRVRRLLGQPSRLRGCRRWPPAFALAGTLAVGAFLPTALTAGEAVSSPLLPERVGAATGPRSWKTLRDENVVRQALDYSCGAAALATLLRHGFGEPVTEADMLAILLRSLSPDEADLRRASGFSLLDLQRVANAYGYRAQGFRLEAGDLPRLGGAVIVFIAPEGYEHFAVLRGVRGERAFLADPARGNVVRPFDRFVETWRGEDGRGVVFAVEPLGDTARAAATDALTIGEAEANALRPALLGTRIRLGPASVRAGVLR